MTSEENLDEYGRNMENYSDILENVLSTHNYHPRRVSFPQSDRDLVTGYSEPADPLRLAINVDKTELLKSYELSCERHNTDPIRPVVDQIKSFNICDDRTDRFNLSKVTLTCYGCESLEEVFKRVQFVYVDLTDCGLTHETASALFEMFEYYESAVHLNLSSNINLGVRGWQACARYIKKSNTLEQLEMRDIQLTDTEADCLLKPLALNRHLQVLKLENCNLNGNAMRSLVNALTNNKTLKELYLADNKIGIFEATLLGTLLKLNKSLQVLDLSNNQIQDAGVNHLVLGLCGQVFCGCLEMLILWNNYLTRMCSSYISNLLREHRSLTILNIGCNYLHDSFVCDVKEALKQNQTILRLGLQATKLSCTSAINLAEVLKTNTTIERIDLRENSILFPGMRALADCLDVNRNVIQIDLNETTSEKNVEEYHSLIIEIRIKCLRNKEKPSPESETNRLAAPRPTSRKISLTCQTLTQKPFEVLTLLSEPKRAPGKLRSPAPSPAPSPIPSPVSSPVPPITKSRFSVSRVSESKNSCIQSRFTVLSVTETPVTTSSGSTTVGFDCKPILPTTPPVESSQNGCIIRKSDSATDSELSSCDCIKSSDSSKPMSSIEKLLSIFQAPTNRFLKPNPPLTKQCDNLKHLPFTNISVNKNVNNPSTIISESPNAKTESIKENISPDNSLTKYPMKKMIKIEYNSSCALDKDNEVKNSNGDSLVDNPMLPMCNSSEDSDSGLVGSIASGTTDSASVISDDSVNSATPSVQSPASDTELSEHSEHSDLTNNNKWRATANTDTN